MVQFNLCVADFFGDYDAHSLGVITLAQFRQGMANAFGKPYARVEVTAEELLLLEEAYSKRIPNQPVPTQGARNACGPPDAVGAAVAAGPPSS